MKVLVLTVLVAVCQVHSYPGDKHVTAPAEIWNEEECLRVGGVCALSSACPEGATTHTGLCPKQRKDGIECCQTIPTNIKDCRGRGGECVPAAQCGNAPREDAQCPADQVCCIFLK